MYGGIYYTNISEHVRSNPDTDGAPSYGMGKELDLRDVPPPERHPKIHESFESLDGGDTLTIINDHEPKPLYYEMKEEVEEFDADGYEVEQEGPQKFVAKLPKQ